MSFSEQFIRRPVGTSLMSIGIPENAVMALMILVLGVLSYTRMVVDIFPNVDIPVVAVVWSYPGLPAEDMERRVVLIAERAYSTTVNGIERIESNSIPGIPMS